MTSGQLQRQRVQLMLQHPFLAAAIARLPIVDGTDLPWCATAATDGYRVFVDLNFFGSLSEADARFVLAHEYLHVILGHGDRRRDRTRRTWNLATDFAVNQTLVEFGFEVPEGGLFDKRFRGETAEAIYDALLETRIPEIPHLAGMAGHGGMPGQGAIAGRGDLGEPSASRGDMAVTPAATPGDAHARLQDALTDGQRARLLAPGGWDLQLDPSDAEGANTTEGGSLTALERRRLRQSLASAMKSRAHGRAAGYLADEIEAAAEPYVSWESLLAQFVGGIRRSDYRTFPFNKKHVHRGIYLPSLGTPGPEHLVVAMDTSGSISLELASTFLGEIDAIRGTGECKLTLLYCDTRITQVTVFEPWDEAFADAGRVSIHGRGGTSFAPPFEWVDQQVEAGEAAPDALIYLTDGFGPFVTVEPMFPVLWVLSAGGADERVVPFGSIIRMPRSATR